MTAIRTRVAAALLALVGGWSVALAQGPVQERIRYTIDTPHAMRMGDYVLPPGSYVLHQLSATDPNRFALYRGDDMDEPIAVIHTTRVDYTTGEYREKSGIALTIVEGRAGAQPVLRGWVVAGLDGWEVISVDADDDAGVLVRVP